MSTDMIDLDRLYSPSKWSLRYPTAEELLLNHVKTVTEASKAAVKNIPHELDIKYGPTTRQKIDIFGTDLPNDAPIFVYIHGGYWQELSKEQSRYPAQSLYRSQIKTIVVGYELCPFVTLPDIVNQIEEAVKLIFEYAQKNMSRGIYFAGHSAGAHLLAMVFSDSRLLAVTPNLNLLRGIFFISGIYDLQDLVKTTVNNAVKLPQDLAVPFSPLLKSYQILGSTKVRIYIIAGENDSPVFKKQSADFYNHLKKKYLPDFTYMDIKDNYDHFDIVETLSDENNYLKELLLEDLRNHLLQE